MNRNSQILDASRHLTHPRTVIVDPELSTADKIAVLEDWRADLIEMQRAAEENMPSATTPPGTVAERLRQVGEALEILRKRL